MTINDTNEQDPAPYQPTPAEGGPAGSTPPQAKLVEADSSDSGKASPADAGHVETGLVASVSVESLPSETNSAEAKPVETDSGETGPVESTPAETNRVEADAVQASPAEFNPVESAAADASKRPTRRRFWAIAVLGLGMLLVGLALGSFISVGWAQNFSSPQTILHTWLAQAPLPEGIKTSLVGTLPGAEVSRMPSPTSGFTATPVPPNPEPTRVAGIVTMLTLTPTGVDAWAGPANASPEPASPDGGEATLSAGWVTPTAQVPPASTPPTGTPTLAIPVPSGAPGQSPSPAQLEADMQNLYQILQTLSQWQPTGEELAAMHVLVNGLAEWMATLSAQLQATQAASETAPPVSAEGMGRDAPISPGEIRDLLNIMQEELEILHVVLADPSADKTTLDQGKTLLSQLQGMIGQAQILVAQGLSARVPDPTPANPTPTKTPDPTATPTPTVIPRLTTTAEPTLTPMLDTGVDSHLNQLQEMMNRMEQMLGHMQSMLGQMQNSPPSGATPIPPPQPGNPARKNRPTPIKGTPGAATPDLHTPTVRPTDTAPAGIRFMEGQGPGPSGSSMPCMGDAGSPATNAAPVIPDSSLTRTLQVGSVMVAVTPVNLRTAGLATLDFYVVIDTHSVDLSMDLTGLIVLRLPSGVDLQAMRWTGPRGGHHVEGTLSFPRTDAAGNPVILPSTGVLTLLVRSLVGAGEQALTWDLSQVH